MNLSSNKNNNSFPKIINNNINLIIDDFTEYYEKIKDLIKKNKEYNDLILNELINLVKSIKYPNYYK